jgi:hypothetical protein
MPILLRRKKVEGLRACFSRSAAVAAAPCTLLACRLRLRAAVVVAGLPVQWPLRVALRCAAGPPGQLRPHTPGAVAKAARHLRLGFRSYSKTAHTRCAMLLFGRGIGPAVRDGQESPSTGRGSGMAPQRPVSCFAVRGRFRCGAGFVFRGLLLGPAAAPKPNLAPRVVAPLCRAALHDGAPEPAVIAHARGRREAVWAATKRCTACGSLRRPRTTVILNRRFAGCAWPGQCTKRAGNAGKKNVFPEANDKTRL